MTPGRPDTRPSPYGPLDHVLAPIFVVACLDRLAAAALAEAARHAAGAGLLAAWWAWHGPRLALETPPPAGGRDGR